MYVLNVLAGMSVYTSKLWSTRLVFKVSQERPFMVFSCHVSRWFQFQVFYWALKVPFKYNATCFLYLWLTKLYDMSQVTSFLTGFLFHISITANLVISGYLSNIVDVTFNRISSWFHNIQLISSIEKHYVISHMVKSWKFCFLYCD